MKKYIVLLIVFILIIVLYNGGVIPPFTFCDRDFNITTIVSKQDRDHDGVDDQSDILSHAFHYIETRPKYKSAYYATGYPDDGYGVCTDVVAFSLRGAGYDLMELVNQDILNSPNDYEIHVVDKNIDFRRVRNLLIYFKRNAISLTTDLSEISEWQGGDIVVFDEHIGIVSNKRNYKGIPLLIHHANPFQFRYEEDVMEYYEILAHYRISE